jgi:hypothetical protein
MNTSCKVCGVQVADSAIQRKVEYYRIVEKWVCPFCRETNTVNWTGVGFSSPLAFASRQKDRMMEARKKLWLHRAEPGSLYRVHNGLDS